MHKGLDAVFGESRKNAVLDGLYGQMHEQIEAVNTGYGRVSCGVCGVLRA